MAEFRRISETEAQGGVGATFTEIKADLGVATVGALFEQLAVYPRYLQLAWRNLRPNAATVYFQRITYEIEDRALRSAGGGGRRRPVANGDQTLSALEARIHLDSVMVMCTAALRYGTNGQLPKMLWLTPEEKRRRTPEPAPVIPAEEAIPVEDGAAAAGLRHHAALAAESLPYRMEISATACRQSGVSEDQIDSIRAVLNHAWDQLPRILLSAAGIVTAERASEPRAVATV